MIRFNVFVIGLLFPFLMINLSCSSDNENISGDKAIRLKNYLLKHVYLENIPFHFDENEQVFAYLLPDNNLKNENDTLGGTEIVSKVVVNSIEKIITKINMNKEYNVKSIKVFKLKIKQKQSVYILVDDGSLHLFPALYFLLYNHENESVSSLIPQIFIDLVMGGENFEYMKPLVQDYVGIKDINGDGVNEMYANVRYHNGSSDDGVQTYYFRFNGSSCEFDPVMSIETSVILGGPTKPNEAQYMTREVKPNRVDVWVSETGPYQDQYVGYFLFAIDDSVLVTKEKVFIEKFKPWLYAYSRESKYEVLNKKPNYIIIEEE